MGRLVLKAAEAEAALEAGRDRTEALRTHAENLAGIVERLSQRPLDRLLRKLRG
jgi:hypothetical protein